MSTPPSRTETEHHAAQALLVLARVQRLLERVASGDGSAALLETARDQLGDAVRIIDMATADT